LYGAVLAFDLLELDLDLLPPDDDLLLPPDDDLLLLDDADFLLVAVLFLGIKKWFLN
jgi:hypothetical protein